jgi:hypothetical protein
VESRRLLVEAIAVKHAELAAIAHNIADSMASGLCFVIGYYSVDVFAEAARNEPPSLTIDFLHGRVVDGVVSKSLQRAVELFRDALPEFCGKHGASVDDFSELRVRFEAHRGPRFVVSVEDRRGRRSETEYAGVPGERIKVLDQQGRIRPKPRSKASPSA